MLDANYREAQPLGYQQFTAGTIDAATALTVPTGAVLALVRCNTQAVRFRDDNTDPTTTVGFPIPTGELFRLEGQLGKYKFISQVAGAIMDVVYYGFHV